MALSLSAHAQTFDSGSDGTDGALSLTEAGTIVFDPRSFDPPLDQDGDGVYHFTTITVGEGVAVRLRSDTADTRPIVWLASGDVAIDGTVDLSGDGGHGSSSIAVPASPGPGGFAGGIGKRSFASKTAGLGPGGGGSADGGVNVGGGGGGFGAPGGDGISSGTLRSPGGGANGNRFLLPLWGGSGGGGGGGPNDIDASSGGGGGGAGGGALLVASSTAIRIDGTVRADGGNGGSGGTSYRGGGGGAGGAIRLVATRVDGAGSLSVAGGPPGNQGGSGGQGRIRIEAFRVEFSGTTVPGVAPAVATPGILFPPDTGPSLRVTSVAGVPLPENPLGGFAPADITIDEVGEATFEIEARGIPVGTVVNLNMINETEGVLDFVSTPLSGTETISTATASVQIPHGFSRFTVRATIDP